MGDFISDIMKLRKQNQKQNQKPQKQNQKQKSNNSNSSGDFTQDILRLRAERDAPPKPKLVKPVSQGFGDFRQAESKLKPVTTTYREPVKNTAKEQRERFTKSLPKFLQGPVNTVNRFLTSAEESKGGKFYLRSGEKAANTAFLNNEDSKTSTGSKKLDFVADILGGLGGFINPQAPANAVFKGGTMVAEKGLGKFAPKLAQSKLATNIIGGAGAGATTGTAEGIIEGKNAKETAKLAGKRAAEFGAVGAVGHAVGKVAEKGIGKLGEVFSGKPKFSTNKKEINELTDILKPKEAKVLSPKLEPPLAKAKVTSKNTKQIKPFAYMLRDKGLEKLKATPTKNEVAPTKILNESTPSVTLTDDVLKGGPKERQFGQSVINSQVATNEIKQGIKENPLTYEPITNKETFNKATQTVKSDPAKALEYFNSPSKGVNADDVAIGEALITKAIKEGNNDEANRLIADLAEKLTTAGQAVQAASIFKRLTPEGMLLYAQRMVNSINKEQLAKFGKKAQKVELTPEDSTFILDTMKKVQKLPDGREKDIGLAQINQLLANKSPATRSEKVKALQRISLLLNPRTMGRNIIGNTIFGTLDNVSNTLATPIDILIGKLTGKRTATLPSLTGQLKSARRGIEETVEDARLGISTYNTGTQYELPNKQIFQGDDLTNKVLNKFDQATKVGLELGDRPFFQAAYDDVLRQQMKANGITEPTQEMMEQAYKIAQQRTYQDVNGLTNAFKKAQSALNGASSYFGIGTKDFGLGNLVLPFVKTPANILSRAIEYSPAGVTKAIKEAFNIRNGTFDQRTFVDSIARSVTGTALIMVGYDLAKDGILTGSSSKDKDLAAFERSVGKNDFAYRIGDKYYTYDWAQPVSMGLAIGADIFLQGRDRKDAENVVADAIKSGGETLFKQSLLQGLQRFMGGFNPVENIESTVVNAPSQFIPTLSGQINQLTDPIQRNTYSDNILGTGYNLIKGKIPGASQTLEPKIDTFGKTVLRNQGNNNLFNVLLNPGETTEFKPNKLQKEILRLYDVTGNKDVFPKVAPKSFTAQGEKYQLTPKEQTKFQQTMGKRTEQLMNQAKIEPFMTDELKAKIYADAIQDAYDEAKAELIKNRQK